MGQFYQAWGNGIHPAFPISGTIDHELETRPITEGQEYMFAGFQDECESAYRPFGLVREAFRYQH